MEKRKLKTLNELVGDYFEQTDYSADMYFIIKDLDKKFVQYKIEPDEDLKKELIEGFNDQLEKLATTKSIFKIVPILDDNEHGDYVLYLDNIGNNRTAKEIFSFSKKDVQTYSTEHGDYGSIFGFLLELYDGKKRIKIFKKSIATNAITKSKYISIFPGVDHKFTNLKKDAVYFSKSIDVINIENDIVVKNYGVYENNFGFKDVLNKKAAESFKLLLAINGFFFTDNAINRYAKFNDSTKKKIINCLNNNPILVKENFKGIVKQAKKDLKYEFKMTLDDRIKIDTVNDINNLISILNRDINYNTPAKEVYLTRNKKLLRRFKHK
ncbi:MAG: DUF4868 domain-containing protein [Bacteroidia bacterium]|nr:DUF4868 domain-containing protein [Bacteroidia bacterium]